MHSHGGTRRCATECGRRMEQRGGLRVYGESRGEETFLQRQPGDAGAAWKQRAEWFDGTAGRYTRARTCDGRGAGALRPIGRPEARPGDDGAEAISPVESRWQCAA